jgi:hypothetical protein
MGSVATSNAIDRVLARHESELVEEILDDLPSSVRALHPSAWVSNEGFYIRRVLVFHGPEGTVEDLELRQLTPSELAYRYPAEPMPF